MKAEIKRCFNKAALTYDSCSQVQQAAGRNLINSVKNHPAKNIIDLGCGTGLVTIDLADKMNYRNFYAIDIADKFIITAKDRLSRKNIHVVENDFDSFNFLDVFFDLAFSNMALQWSSQLDKTLSNIYKNLSSDGVVAFSIPLDGTFHELKNYDKNHFYSEKDIIKTLNNSGFKLINYSSESLTLFFDSLFLAIKNIKSIGANFVFNRDKKTLSSRKNMFDHKKVSLTYHVGYFIARKVT